MRIKEVKEEMLEILVSALPLSLVDQPPPRLFTNVTDEDK